MEAGGWCQRVGGASGQIRQRFQNSFLKIFNYYLIFALEI